MCLLDGGVLIEDTGGNPPCKSVGLGRILYDVPPCASSECCKYRTGHTNPEARCHSICSVYSSKLLNVTGFTPGTVCFLELYKYNCEPFCIKIFGQLDSELSLPIVRASLKSVLV